MKAFVDAVIAWDRGELEASRIAMGLAAEVVSVVLVEGLSDQAALDTLASRIGRDLSAEGVAVVPMGGATSIARYVRLLGPHGLGLRLLGLCDVRESKFYRAALGHESSVFVCDADLEDEFIRAVGLDGVEAVIEAEGDLPRLRTFQNQPAQRIRTTEQQLRRFMGTIRGRKIRYAGRLAEAVDLERAPKPLLQLLAQV